MADFHMETHPNPNEIFPLKGTLGAPGDTAKGAALLGNLLAAAAALALAAAAFFFPYADCTPLLIESTSARFEADVFNLDPEDEVLWYLVPGKAPESLPGDLTEDGLTKMEQESETLSFTELEPGTEYTIVFVTKGPDGTEMLHTFTFRTPDGGSKAPEEPPAPPPAPPGDQEFGQQPDPEPGPEPDPTPDLPDLEPPVPPTFTPGAGGDGEEDAGGSEDSGESTPPSGPSGPSYLNPIEDANRNTLTQLPSTTGDLLYRLTINEITQGQYPLHLTQLSIYLEDGVDYNNYIRYEITDFDQLPAQSGSTITYDFVVPESLTQNGWIDVSIIASANSFTDLQDPATANGKESQTYLYDRIVLDEPYMLTLAELPSVNNFEVINVTMYSESVEASGFPVSVTPGDFVYMDISLALPEGAAHPGPFTVVALATDDTGAEIDRSFDQDIGAEETEFSIALGFQPSQATNISLQFTDPSGNSLPETAAASFALHKAGTFSAPIEDPVQPAVPQVPAPVSSVNSSWNSSNLALDSVVNVVDTLAGTAPVQVTKLTVTITRPQYMDVTNYVTSALPQNDPSAFTFSSGTYSLPLSLDLSGVTFGEVVGGGLPSSITLDICVDAQFYSDSTGKYEATQNHLTRTVSLQ